MSMTFCIVCGVKGPFPAGVCDDCSKKVEESEL